MDILKKADLGEGTTIELLAIPEDIRLPFRVRLVDDDTGEEVPMFTRRYDDEAAAQACFDRQVDHHQAHLLRSVAA
jgi:hypothetical protein